jgi:hypothetical protein
MALEHPELGMVPTYGGPYDSYTIPHLGGKADQPWHERELRMYRYDHDLGGWRTDEVEVIPLRIVHEDVLNERHDAAPQASSPDFADAYEGAREDLAIWKRRALEAENLLRIERDTSRRLVAELNAQNGPTHMGEPAPQASEAVRTYTTDEVFGPLFQVRNAALEEAAQALEKRSTESRNEYDHRKEPYFEGSADAYDVGASVVRALKTQADKDGGDCAKGAAKRLHGLVEEAISWLETGGGRADSLCADLRKALAASKQEK